MKQILVIDGLGGGLGAELIARLKTFENISLIAIGTNSFATGNMLKAGALRGATGENAIRVGVEEADIIAGPWGIVIPNGLMGEVTPKMALAIVRSKAIKVLIPISHPTIVLIEESSPPLNRLIELAVNRIKEIANE
ncbi:MAG: DUF3842 family protein [bacterium]